MNFERSEEETMLADLADRFVADRYDIERRCAYQTHPQGFSQENWDLLAEFGLMAAPLDERDGGMNLDAGAIVALFGALGRGLVTEPLTESVLVGARLLLAGAGEDLAAAWREGLSTGTRRVALAHAEPSSRGNAAWVETRSEAGPGTVRLSGIKHCVPAGVGADAFVVSARTATSGGSDGVGFYLVPADAPGLTLTPWRMIDGSVAAHLALDGVTVPADHALSGGLALLDQVMPLADLARAAEAVGVMQRIFDETLEYLRTRSQFNTPLGRFQAIQHRMVAHYCALEQSKALLNLALVGSGDGGDPASRAHDFAHAVAGARAFISEVSLALGHDMIQFHGGMGVTDELAIGHGHKRLVLLSRWPEEPLAKLDRYAGLAA